jgi:hypothetical protein
MVIMDIVVLDDGETWGDLRGSKVNLCVTVDSDGYELGRGSQTVPISKLVDFWLAHHKETV